MLPNRPAGMPLAERSESTNKQEAAESAANLIGQAGRASGL